MKLLGEQVLATRWAKRLVLGWRMAMPTRFFTVGVEFCGTNWKEGNIASLDISCFLFGITVMFWWEHHTPADWEDAWSKEAWSR